MPGRFPSTASLTLLLALSIICPAKAQVAVMGKSVYTMAGLPIKDGMVLIQNGKVARVGKARDIKVPDGFRLLKARVVTPGLIDAHTVVGLAGAYNSPHDQDQIEASSPIQPDLRALDAYNPREKLIEWVRGFGVTTLQTGHAPGELVSGQMMIVKTTGNTVEDALVDPTSAVAVTLGLAARKGADKSPGTRSKMMAMLRAKLIAAQEYLAARERDDKDGNDEDKEKKVRNLGLEVLVRVLRREVPLLVTAHKAQDIANALRLADEFKVRLILDGAAEATLLTEKILTAGVPVIIHPSMIRAHGEAENASFQSAAKLKHAGVPVALQSGYESYVPKTRVVLFEAAIAAANGLTFEEALATITIDAARILGIDSRVGSLAVDKDGDIALFDGDPFEYTTRCVATIIEGKVVSDTPR